ncbi:hypothetical protein Ssi03_76380 [Sphaerisporangium siamense]|uniref:Uncharacterized protein n=1 Tax=Sphaerisporangium siamense TaxID=795645 RepID=A0A7W7D3I7_9ACTN|nr:hypothetical protein [Sphaerisporangium siamense]MBB4699319.1 hypothetical protein [Sphaerisporangium siamense]GII89648.1 hypothetical protein Ssi03_76380 [Sphaerisporangium siamense]
MTTTINPKDYRHGGRCDHEGEHSFDCDELAVAAVISATVPDTWADGAPAASVAFMCSEHLAGEPIAQREHAEHNAQQVPHDDPSRALWGVLLAGYPNPIPVAPIHA